MPSINRGTRRSLYMSFVFVTSFMLTFFTVSMLSATEEQTIEMQDFICGTGSTASSPVNPPGTIALARYEFDDGQINEEDKTTHNQTMPVDVSWMDGQINGDLSLISGGNVGNKALSLNVPYQQNNIEDVTPYYGQELTFQNGIVIEAKICLHDDPSDPVPNNPPYIIASQMTNISANKASWRLAIDKINGEGDNLTFMAWFNDGTYKLIKYRITGTIKEKWITVAAVYNKSTGYMSLYWNGIRVVHEPVGGLKTIRLTKDPVRIGRGEPSNITSVFRGAIDNVKIWGDSPACSLLRVNITPPSGGSVTITPIKSTTGLCSNLVRNYPPGEKIQLTAVPNSPDYLFYKWIGGLNYIGEASDQKFSVTFVMDKNIDVVTQFIDQDDTPVLERFPVFGSHNTSIDPASCEDGSPCQTFCGAEAVAVSNDVCHDGGAQDIFAEVGEPVIAAQDGTILFGCNTNGGNWATIIQGDFIHHYSHFDEVCFAEGTNPCADVYEPEATNLISCQHYFENGDTVIAGMQIGTVGRSGSAISTTAHLHYQIQTPSGFYCNGPNEMDPFPFLYTLEATSCEGEIYRYPTIITFTATPPEGNNPLPVTFEWNIDNPRNEDLTCTLDFGDGSTPINIDDCDNNTVETHTYYAQNAHIATLSLSQAGMNEGTVATLYDGQDASTIIRVAKWASGNYDEIETSPALNVNTPTIYFTVMGDLVALNTTNGKTEWVYSTGAYNFDMSSPVVGLDGAIYFATAQRVYAINSNGTLRWSFQYPSATWASELAIGYDGTIYIESQDDQGYGSTDCALYAIGPTTGNLIWRLQLGTIHCQASDPVVGANGIYTWYEDDFSERLYAISTAGTVQWTLEAPMGTSPILNTPGQVVVMIGNQLKGIDAPTGIVVWTNTFPFSAGCASLAMAHDGTIYIVDSQGILHSTLGSLLRWSVDIHGGCSSPAIDSQGNVYVGSDDYHLYMISYGGSILATYATGGVIESSVTMGNGALYIPSTDGYVYAFSSSASLDTGNWPKYRNNAANAGRH